MANKQMWEMSVLKSVPKITIIICADQSRAGFALVKQPPANVPHPSKSTQQCYDLHFIL